MIVAREERLNCYHVVHILVGKGRNRMEPVRVVADDLEALHTLATSGLRSQMVAHDVLACGVLYDESDSDGRDHVRHRTCIHGVTLTTRTSLPRRPERPLDTCPVCHGPVLGRRWVYCSEACLRTAKRRWSPEAVTA